ncbi:hypothetical protein SAMN05216511_0051 [Streptomyces sp. KS_16]|nr:hypothetical protein BX261_7197 [Streptomyces sp. 2321.6]SDQ62865.1 hypothetical protein SAMN05216511_0051 [Streptomyces sp. KS_16]SNC74237.1 hypothetical protein SAMN06272741_7123 [Streptomyces sp. 2114.4]
MIQGTPIMHPPESTGPHGSRRHYLARINPPPPPWRALLSVRRESAGGRLTSAESTLRALWSPRPWSAHLRLRG